MDVPAEDVPGKDIMSARGCPCADILVEDICVRFYFCPFVIKGEPLNIIHSKNLLTSSENIFNKQLTVNQTRSNGDSIIKMENIPL